MDDTVFAFVRADDVKHGCESSGAERVLVVVNHSTQPRSLAIPAQNTALEGRSQFAAALESPQASSNGSGSVTVQLAPEQTAIYLVH